MSQKAPENKTQIVAEVKENKTTSVAVVKVNQAKVEPVQIKKEEKKTDNATKVAQLVQKVEKKAENVTKKVEVTPVKEAPSKS